MFCFQKKYAILFIYFSVILGDIHCSMIPLPSGSKRNENKITAEIRTIVMNALGDLARGYPPETICLQRFHKPIYANLYRDLKRLPNAPDQIGWLTKLYNIDLDCRDGYGIFRTAVNNAQSKVCDYFLNTYPVFALEGKQCEVFGYSDQSSECAQMNALSTYRGTLRYKKNNQEKPVLQEEIENGEAIISMLEAKQKRIHTDRAALAQYVSVWMPAVLATITAEYAVPCWGKQTEASK